MDKLIPHRLLIDLEFPLRFRAKPPVIDGTLSGWTNDELLPPTTSIDGHEPFAPVWACWNESGLFVAARVTGKRLAPVCDPKVYWKSDNLRVCTDMRDARANKRATRFCQQFFFLPTGGGRDGKRPAGGSNKIHRAREDAPSYSAQPVGESAKPVSQRAQGQPGDTSQPMIKVAAQLQKGGYGIEAHVPAGCLAGFDPVEHPRIGFYYMLEDRELGQQFLTVGDELNWHIDPSTWATAVLTR